MPRVPESHIEEVCRRIQAGEKQRDIARETKFSTSHVSRCVNLARQALTQAENDPSWIDSIKRTHVQVANAWLARFRP